MSMKRFEVHNPLGKEKTPGEIRREIEDELEKECPTLSLIQIEKVVDYLVRKQKEMFFEMRNDAHQVRNEQMIREGRHEALHEMLKQWFGDKADVDCTDKQFLRDVRIAIKTKIRYD